MMINKNIQQEDILIRSVPTEFDIANVICNRFGSGEVYLPTEKDSNILTHAINNGYVSVQGYLTSKGRGLVGSYGL